MTAAEQIIAILKKKLPPEDVYDLVKDVYLNVESDDADGDKFDHVLKALWKAVKD